MTMIDARKPLELIAEKLGTDVECLTRALELGAKRNAGLLGGFRKRMLTQRLLTDVRAVEQRWVRPKILTCDPAEYIKEQEFRRGLPFSEEEILIIERCGCSGMHKVRTGHTFGRDPIPLAFADPGTHSVINDLNKILQPGDRKNAEIMSLMGALKVLEGYKRNCQERINSRMSLGIKLQNGDDMDLKNFESEIGSTRAKIERLSREAQQEWGQIGEDYASVLHKVRDAAVEVGDNGAFQRALQVRDQLSEILHKNPGNKIEVMKLVRAHPNLAPLSNEIEHILPDEPLENFAKTPIISCLQFWDGQDIAAPRQFPRATIDPHPELFAPDKRGVVAMDQRPVIVGRPGLVPFDISDYDPETGVFWGANHSHRENDPMIVHGTPLGGFVPTPDFNCRVIGLCLPEAWR